METQRAETGPQGLAPSHRGTPDKFYKNSPRSTTHNTSLWLGTPMWRWRKEDQQQHKRQTLTCQHHIEGQQLGGRGIKGNNRTHTLYQNNAAGESSRIDNLFNNVLCKKPCTPSPFPFSITPTWRQLSTCPVRIDK
jgi:hypothetical protein